MAEPRPGEPPPPGKRAERLLDDDQLPASVGQLKTLRRWLIVAGVWSVAATAIAVFALIQADEADETAGEQAAGELGRVQRQLDQRIDGLESQIEELPTSEDLARLDDRLAEVEDGASQTSAQLDRLGGRIDDLEQQVQELEDSADTPATDTTETAP